jgi:hypothetical protein
MKTVVLDCTDCTKCPCHGWPSGEEYCSKHEAYFAEGIFDKKDCKVIQVIVMEDK